MEHFEAACLPDKTDDIWKSNLHNGSHWDFPKGSKFRQPLIFCSNYFGSVEEQKLVGGFKYFSCSPLRGEDSHFN